MAFATMATRSAGYVVPASEWNQLIANDNYLKGAVSAQIFFSAAGMAPRVSNGCAPLATTSMGTNKQDIKTLNFDPNTIEVAESVLFIMPSDYNGWTFTYKIIYTHAAATTNFGIVWDVNAVAYASNTFLDAAFGTLVEVNDADGGTLTCCITPASAAVTPGGAPAAGCGMIIQVMRYASHASDTLAIDAMLIGLQLTYTRI